jgi:histidyl-tRNA synthetase
VKPRLSRGLRDLLPEQIGARQRMIDTIRGVYENYGFVPLDTPAIEYLEVLKGSEAGDTAGQVFGVAGPEEEALGLRFDLTVPLARVVAQYRDLPRPFRRYHVGPVWRADKPDPGRYREFTQFDLDSVGAPSEVADTEIIAGMCDTLTALGAEPYRVRFSSRGVLNLLLPHAGIPRGRGADVFRVLDKLDKIGPAKVRLELTAGYQDESGDRIPGLGLEDRQVDAIEAFLAIESGPRDGVLEELRRLFAGVEGADDEIEVLARISHQLDVLGYGEDRAALDVSIARGLGYYTGPVWEAVLLDAPQFGSVFGGGRYDDLVMRFLGERVPATGGSIGVDRLLAALVHLGRLQTRHSTAEVLVTVLDRSMLDDYLTLTWELRRAGIPTELYLGSGRNPGKQMKYADRTGVPLALLYGPDEKARGVVAVKDLAAGRERSQEIEGREQWVQERPGQRDVPREGLVPALRELLEQIRAAG